MGTKKYELSNDEGCSLSSKMLFITASKYEKDWVSSVHYHPFMEIFYVKSGNGFMNIENKLIPIKANTLVTINANIQHTELSDKTDPLEYYIIGADSININSMSSATHSIISYPNELNPAFNCFTSILKEMEEQREGYALVCQNIFEILIIQLCRNKGVFYSSSDEEFKINWHCHKIRQHIDFNYQDKISLDSLAEISNLNKYYLSHKFSELYGISPIAYLNKVRIDACQDLLKNTNHSIEDIALMTGFSSRSYMAQVFLKICSITARQYRKLYRIGETGMSE